MVMCCAVLNCTNRAKKGSGVTFHSFPADKELLDKWLLAIGRQDYKPNDFAKVCSVHFHKDEIYMDKYNRRFVKKGVVPSRFCNVRKIKRIKKIIAEAVPEVANEVIISSDNAEVESFIESMSKSMDYPAINISSEIQLHNDKSNESENNITATVANNEGIWRKSICDQFPEFLKPKTNNDANKQCDVDNNVSIPTSVSGINFVMTVPEKNLIHSDTKTRSNSVNKRRSNSISNALKRNKSLRRKREIGIEDFEKINEARLADPKVVKQLLIIAYKTIQEQRKLITNWQLKCKNMEQKIVYLHKALRELKYGRYS